MIRLARWLVTPVPVPRLILIGVIAYVILGAVIDTIRILGH